MADYIYIVQLDVPAEIEDEFNRLYDAEHVPNLLSVPGVRTAHRYKLEYDGDGTTPRYLAIYELESPDLPKSAAWKAKADLGEWVTKIRPQFTARKNATFRRIS